MAIIQSIIQSRRDGVSTFVMDDACAYPSYTTAVGRVMLLQAILQASGLDETGEVQKR